MQKSELLRKIYYDPSSPGGYASAQKLYTQARKRDVSVKYKDVVDWLKGEVPYTLHRKARRRFTRNRIVVWRIDQQWEADLVEMQEFSRQNNGIRYLLTIIDVFSKQAFVKCLKNKTAGEVSKAFADVFKTRSPESIRTDRGKEFLNSSVKDVFKVYNVIHYTAHNQEIKCGVVERFNRTLKNRMFRYFTSKGTRRFEDVLGKLVDGYNKSYHRVIKTAPASVNCNNADDIFKNVYGYISYRDYLRASTEHPRYKVGCIVRIRYQLGPFDKSFYPTWTDTVYKIKSVDNSGERTVYTLEDYNGVEIKNRKFYHEELQEITETTHRVEKVIKSRTVDGERQLFVKWVGYDNSYNSWIKAQDLVTLA